jgi:hypothetical protein
MTYALISYVFTVVLWVAWAMATASRERRLRGE